MTCDYTVISGQHTSDTHINIIKDRTFRIITNLIRYSVY